jgi:hypothetical protein
MFLKVATKTNWDTRKTYLQITKVGGETKSIIAPFPPLPYSFPNNDDDILNRIND